MTSKHEGLTPFSVPLSRRRLALGVTVSAASALLGGRGAAAHVVDFEHGRTYLTRTDDGLHLAILVSGSDAIGFVADGAGRADWFVGSPGRSMSLVADDGAHMTASFTINGFKGRVVGADGRAFTFLAEEASGIGGLFAANFAEGYVTGVSDTGCHLVASEAAALPDGRTFMRGLVITQSHGSTLFEAVASADSWGRQWWIVQQDGLVAGGSADDKGFGFVCSKSESA